MESPTVGFWFGVEETSIVTGTDVVLPLSRSNATALSAYVPTGTADQVMVNGAAVSEPIRVDPA